ncbi:hypothetical protein [Roseiconus lacunae]|uniref:hypothetical protein n=1 Tax=Roseiconus lacunae TaxID=2605694 RepID=UPI001E34C6DB|nr:hypothetical protein [Roseiconus lacunae]MCD0462088.1 hypothetical protein [Roseiconus lacunae]
MKLALHKESEQPSLDLQLFRKLYPGRFEVRPGRDGIDETFSITCRRTGDFIASTNYWYAASHAHLRASVIAHCLSQGITIPPASLAFQYFRMDFPPPYHIEKFEHEMEGPGFSIVARNCEYVLNIFGDSENERLFASVIAEVLNHKFTETTFSANAKKSLRYRWSRKAGV